MIGYSRNRAGNVSLGSTVEANGAIAVALHRCHHCHGLHGCHGDLGRSTLQAGFKLEVVSTMLKPSPRGKQQQ